MNKPALSQIIAVLAALLLAIPAAEADKTLRGRLKPATKRSTSAAAAVFDTIVAPADTLVRLSGYDKPLNSRYETLFATNRGASEIVGLTLQLTYTDMQGRMLHEATQTVRTSIPPGATRQLRFPAWDRQQAFYYHRGRRPRTAGVTPFDVRCSVAAIITPCIND